MQNQFKTQKFKHLMLAMGPKDLNSAPYSPVHCSSHSTTSFQSSELTELPVVENSQARAQRVHSARYAPFEVSKNGGNGGKWRKIGGNAGKWGEMGENGGNGGGGDRGHSTHDLGCEGCGGMWLRKKTQKWEKKGGGNGRIMGRNTRGSESHSSRFSGCRRSSPQFP